MHPKTEQTFGSLEILVESVPCISLSGHEDGGYLYPFAWDVSQDREFNAFNLCISKGWLKLTDKDIVLKNWLEMSYLQSFNAFRIQHEEKLVRQNQITNLFQVINQNLKDISSFTLTSYYTNEVGSIVGQTIDEDWICVCHTLYKETYIPKEQINRTEIDQSSLILEANTLKLISEIEKCISDLDVISLKGDFGGGYGYDYDHKYVCSVAKTKEQAVEKALQKSEILEIATFDGFYPDINELWEREWCDDEDVNRQKPKKFNKLNHFFASSFSEPMMYRFSFWTQENIYIIGETQSGDRAGIYIESNFVYNP